MRRASLPASCLPFGPENPAASASRIWSSPVTREALVALDSYNECVRSGWELQNASAELEAVAGQDVRAVAQDLIDETFEILGRAAEAGIGPETMPDGMWYWLAVPKHVGGHSAYDQRPRRAAVVLETGGEARNAPGKGRRTDEQDVRGGRCRGDHRRPGRGAGETRLGEPARADARRGQAVAGGRSRRSAGTFLRCPRRTGLSPASGGGARHAGREGSDTVVWQATRALYWAAVRHDAI